ncbi:Rop guanine nucleotide exchange factor like [Actinidia chinensis var. chinensis]|uniref:Rop guanine nucleotide exchange factor like n=1 Tax=Actinidia chinensis var. chinensis TaxID=1590841 RepID=A0A2R6PFG9_ACTCC|nr:Rop guanine nucleotide exchange factor like [Actinidia chinensis var. chinensis]
MNRGYFADISEMRKRGGEAMVDSWSVPFLEAFNNSEKVQLYEVSVVDSWLLSRNPSKRLLLRFMRKSKPDERNDVLQR